LTNYPLASPFVPRSIGRARIRDLKYIAIGVYKHQNWADGQTPSNSADVIGLAAGNRNNTSFVILLLSLVAP